MNYDLDQAKGSTWRIVYGHRPLYCGSGSSDCTKWATRLRNQAEDILYKNNADLVLSGHVHNYQRMYPTYKEKKMDEHYDSPKAPVYITNGAAGNREGLTKKTIDKDYQAFAASIHSYGIMKISGKTIKYTQYASSNRTIIDEMIMNK